MKAVKRTNEYGTLAHKFKALAHLRGGTANGTLCGKRPAGGARITDNTNAAGLCLTCTRKANES